MAPSLQSIIQGSQGRNLEVGTEAEAMEECYLLACSGAFLQYPGPPAREWHCVQLALLHRSLIKKIPYRLYDGLNMLSPWEMALSVSISPCWSRCGLVRGSVSLWKQAFEVLNAQGMPSVRTHPVSSCLPLNQDVELSAPSPAPCLLHTAILPAMMIMD